MFRTLKESLLRQRRGIVLSVMAGVSAIGMSLASPALSVGWGEVPEESGSIPWLGCWSHWQETRDREAVRGHGPMVCLERGSTPHTLTRTSFGCP